MIKTVIYEVTFTETGYSEDGYSVTVNGNATATPVKATAAKTIGAANTAAFVNAYTKNPGDLELTKKVSGEGADASKQFEFTIELTAPADVALADSYKYTQSGKGEQTLTLTKDAENPKKGTTTVSLEKDDVITIKDLPAGVTYKITENDYSLQGYQSSLTNRTASGTIEGGTKAKESVEVTNTFSAVDITIKKVNSETGETIGNAEFQLTRKNESSEYVAFPNTDESVKTTAADGTGKGKLSFNTLPNGEYKIEETKAPAGYVKQNNNPIYFKVDNGTVTWTNASGEEINQQNMVEYTNKEFTISNEPGKPLPHTGGIGTTVFYLAGALMMAGAAFAGFRRRRRA